jgi:hypothetical protein
MWKKTSPKKQKEIPQKYWCACDCVQCDIGAHERCTSAECHMPKWKDVKKEKD